MDLVVASVNEVFYVGIPEKKVIGMVKEGKTLSNLVTITLLNEDGSQIADNFRDEFIFTPTARLEANGGIGSFYLLERDLVEFVLSTLTDNFVKVAGRERIHFKFIFS